MEKWEIDRDEAKKAKLIKETYPNIGRIVKYKGEYGVVILGTDCKDDITIYEEVVRWDTNKEFDNEEFGFFDYKFIDEYEFKYINNDGTLKKIKQ